MLATLTLLLATSPLTLRGIENQPYMKAYALSSEPYYGRESATGSTLLASAIYLHGDRKEKGGMKIDVAVYEFKDAAKIPDAIKHWRRSIQAATVGMKVPAIERLGYQSYYLGNPRTCEFDAIVGSEWVVVLLEKPNLSWQPGRSVNWSQEGAKLLEHDKVAMTALKGLLPELLRRIRG